MYTLCHAIFPWANASSTTCTALNAANGAAGYAGITTWRLPTLKELETIVNYDGSNPTTFAANFPAMVVSNVYWSSSTYVPNTTVAWWFWFDRGSVNPGLKTSSYFVHCVAGAYSPAPVYADNGDGAITDAATGLMWQKCSVGQANDASCSGTATTPQTWATALTTCNALTLCAYLCKLITI